MVATRHGLVSAVGSVTVCSVVAGRGGFGIAAIWIHVAHRDRVVMRPPALAVFKAAVVEVIYVTFMLHRDVAAAQTVHMRGTLVGGWHCSPLARFNSHSYVKRSTCSLRSIKRFL